MAATTKHGSLSELGARLQDLVVRDVCRDCQISRGGGVTETVDLVNLGLNLNGDVLFDIQSWIDPKTVGEKSETTGDSSPSEKLELRLTFRQTSLKQTSLARDPSPNFPDKHRLEDEDEDGDVPPSICEDETQFVSVGLSALVAKSNEAAGETEKINRSLSRTVNSKVEASVAAIPRYLIRPGGQIAVTHKVPVAWPPMTDYKSAIIFVDAKSFPSPTCTSYVILKDGNDDIGLTQAEPQQVLDTLSRDAHLLLQLIRHKAWLMDRHIIVIADSVADTVQAGFEPSRGRYTWEYSTLEEFRKEEFPHLPQLQICRCPQLIYFLKPLLFCPVEKETSTIA